MATSDLPNAAPVQRSPEVPHKNVLNADSVTPIPPPKSAIPSTRALLIAGLVTGVTAALACLGMRIVAWIFRADFLADANPFADGVTHVPWQAIFWFPLIAALAGSLISAIFLGVRHGQAIVLAGGTILMLLSLIVPLVWAEGATWPTRIWLVLMHVATWLIVVPQVARVVGDSDPRYTRGFRDDVQPPTSVTA